MTITYSAPAELRFRDLVSVGGEHLGVLTVRPGRLPYKGTLVPVVYLTARRPAEAGGEIARKTLLADQDLVVIR